MVYSHANTYKWFKSYLSSIIIDGLLPKNHEMLSWGKVLFYTLTFLYSFNLMHKLDSS